MTAMHFKLQIEKKYFKMQEGYSANLLAPGGAAKALILKRIKISFLPTGFRLGLRVSHHYQTKMIMPYFFVGTITRPTLVSKNMITQRKDRRV